jgi:DNA repair protein RadC
LFRDKQQEEFWVIYLSSAKRVIAKNTLAIGTTSHVLVDTKIIFKIAIENLATSIILIHNHPSGKPRPSQYDLALTHKLKEAGKLINVDISDHLIIAGKEYYSFKDENIL